MHKANASTRLQCLCQSMYLIKHKLVNLCVLCTQLLLVQPVRFSALVRQSCALCARIYYKISLCIFHRLCVKPVRFTPALINSSTCTFQHVCVSPVRFTHTPNISLTCAFYARTRYWLNSCVFRKADDQ